MSYVTVSPKFQVVVPKDVRSKINLRPGERLSVLEHEGVIHLVPIRSLKSMRGFLKGLTVEGVRDEKDRLG